MNAWPHVNGDAIGRHLRQLRAPCRFVWNATVSVGGGCGERMSGQVLQS